MPAAGRGLRPRCRCHWLSPCHTTLQRALPTPGGGEGVAGESGFGVCVLRDRPMCTRPPALSKLAAARVQPCAQPAGGARLHTRVQAARCPRGCPKELRGVGPSPGLWGRAPRRLRGLLFWCLRRVSRAPSAPALPCPASRHPQQGRLQDVGSPGAPLQPLCWPGVQIPRGSCGWPQPKALIQDHRTHPALLQPSQGFSGWLKNHIRAVRSHGKS